MSTASNIEWTDTTWNPVAGCAKVSAGCKHCYAETMAARHVLMSAAQLLADITYDDCKREGFPDLTPEQFVAFYWRSA